MNEPTPYEALMAIGRSLRKMDLYAMDSEDWKEPSAMERASFLEANRELLEQVRAHLSPDVVAPVHYDASDDKRMTSDYGCPICHLTVALSRKIEEQGAIGDFGSAARWGIDMLDFANGIRRGGLMIDCLISSTVASIAVDGLRKFRDKIPVDDRRPFVEELARVDAQREPFAELLERECAWERKVWTPELLDRMDPESRAEIQSYLAGRDPGDEEPGSHDDTRLSDFQAIAKLRLLWIDIALRAWQAIHGGYPESLDELTPEILPSLPIDPHTDGPFLYRLKGDPFLLYSPGCSGVDHGGTFGPYFGSHRHEFDLGLDSEDFRTFE